MEDNLVPKQQICNTNIHPTYSIAAQEIQDYDEGLLGFRNTEIDRKKELAKISRPEDSVIIKSSIESGEPTLILDDVRRYRVYNLSWY